MQARAASSHSRMARTGHSNYGQATGKKLTSAQSQKLGPINSFENSIINLNKVHVFGLHNSDSGNLTYENDPICRRAFCTKVFIKALFIRAKAVKSCHV